MSKIYVGIDIGKKGGVVQLHPSGKMVKFATPLIKGSTEIDCDEISKHFALLMSDCIMEELQLVCIVENVHSIYGSSARSNFQFGRALGIIEGIVSAQEMPFIKVSPKTWQKVCFEGVPKLYKKEGGVDNKAMALIAVKRLFPGLDLRKSERCTNAHDGIVDALLMAHFAKIKF